MYLTNKEELRIDVLSKYLNGEIHREHAQTVLELGERQFRRLFRKFKEEGIQGVRHGNCGRIPKNKVSGSVVNKIISLYKTKYFGFNVTHFVEMLQKNESIKNLPSYGTVKRILKDNRLIDRKKKRRPSKHHRSRNRYAREGAMVQIDGSHHKWFGHTMSCLTVALDDATGKILSAKFTPTETTFAAMDVVERILRTKGVFSLLYSDRAGIYDNRKRDGYTNMTRALKELGVVSVTASTPQAKGKVERVFKTLQDRLVAELRLYKISSIEGANAYLEHYIDDHNEKYAVTAKDPNPTYRPLSPSIDLDSVLCMQTTRVISNGLRISLDNQTYVIKSNLDIDITKAQVDIKTYRNGTRKFFVRGQRVTVEELNNFDLYA